MNRVQHKLVKLSGLGWSGVPRSWQKSGPSPSGGVAYLWDGAVEICRFLPWDSLINYRASGYNAWNNSLILWTDETRRFRSFRIR